jgi:hypothetical protein
MIRIAASIALLLFILGSTAACSSTMMTEPNPRPASSYRTGPSGTPGELPPGVY